MAARIRRDVWNLSIEDPWHPTLLWYARAVRQMQTRALNDPMGWRYQAAIHEYFRDTDPLASPADVLPTQALQGRFWTQCQHFSWFFLPWHRMYLFFFEQIVAKAVKDVGGPADWALPYWNYSDPNNANARKLPPAFIAQTLPDGSRNPLRVAQRARGNDGENVADPVHVQLRCLDAPDFSTGGLLGGGGGFCGPATGFNHDEGNVVGDLDIQPHGSIHVRVGQWMSGFNTAGLDPIFWVHHANIDRLWTVWRRREDTHKDPTQSAWLTSVPFEFNDAFGGIANMTPSQVVDTVANPLSYQYEVESDPFAPPESPIGLESSRRPRMEKRPAEMIGATEQPVPLTGRTTTTTLAVKTPTGPGAEESLEAAVPARVYLNLENVTGTGQPTGYSVYLNLPPGASPAQHEDLYAGYLPMFGVSEASRKTAAHGGSGLNYVLEIGDIVSRLKSRNAWNPADVRITFVPDEAPTGGLEAAVEASPIQVGRVSVYTQ